MYSHHNVCTQDYMQQVKGMQGPCSVAVFICLPIHCRGGYRLSYILRCFSRIHQSLQYFAAAQAMGACSFAYLVRTEWLDIPARASLSGLFPCITSNSIFTSSLVAACRILCPRWTNPLSANLFLELTLWATRFTERMKCTYKEISTHQVLLFYSNK